MLIASSVFLALKRVHTDESQDEDHILGVG
jgi:hypothetical protein